MRIGFEQIHYAPPVDAARMVAHYRTRGNRFVPARFSIQGLGDVCPAGYSQEGSYCVGPNGDFVAANLPNAAGPSGVIQSGPCPCGELGGVCAYCPKVGEPLPAGCDNWNDLESLACHPELHGSYQLPTQANPCSGAAGWVLNSQGGITWCGPGPQPADPPAWYTPGALFTPNSSDPRTQCPSNAPFYDDLTGTCVATPPAGLPAVVASPAPNPALLPGPITLPSNLPPSGSQPNTTSAGTSSAGAGSAPAPQGSQNSQPSGSNNSSAPSFDFAAWLQAEMIPHVPNWALIAGAAAAVFVLPSLMKRGRG
jgi:hypothetical protein